MIHFGENTDIRNNWSLDEIKAIYYKPVLELIVEAAQVHKKYQATGEVQVCTLLSVKTGGCPEDCSYCPQAARFHTGVDVHKLLNQDRYFNLRSVQRLVVLPVFVWVLPGAKCVTTATSTKCWTW